MNPLHTYWRLKGTVQRLIAPLFFAKVGSGTMFIGATRLPMPLQRIHIGRDCMINAGVYFHTGRSGIIEIGNDSSLNTGCHVVACEAVRIGNNVAIGEYVTIRDQDHLFTPTTGVRGQGFRIDPIIIENNVWIGRGVHIGPGAHIRSGTIVAANSVVRGEHPANVLLAGAPARPRRAILPSGETATLSADETQQTHP